METYTQEQVEKIIEDMHDGYKKRIKQHDDEMKEFTIKYMKGLIIKSALLGLVNGAIIGLMIGSGRLTFGLILFAVIVITLVINAVKE